MNIFDSPYYTLGNMLPLAEETKTPLSYNQIRVKRIKAKRRRKANRGKRK